MKMNKSITKTDLRLSGIKYSGELLNTAVPLEKCGDFHLTSSPRFFLRGDDLIIEEYCIDCGKVLKRRKIETMPMEE